MSFIFQIFLNYLIFVRLPLWAYNSFFASKKYKEKRAIHDLKKSSKHQIHANSDLLSEKSLNSFKEIYQQCCEAKKMSPAEREHFITQSTIFYEKAKHKRTNEVIYELADTLIIAFAIAFGVRSLFLQPFKIPTGSMQPTLYGFHLQEGGNKVVPNALKKVFNYVNYSWRYPESLAKADGKVKKSVFNYNGRLYESAVDVNAIKTSSFLTYNQMHLKMTLETSSSFIPVNVSLPGGKNETFNSHYFPFINEIETAKKGENIINARYVTGDHLFVDRLTFYFREPKRGDITVFITDGFPNMAGRYYVKRLVGLPGETIKVVDHKLYIKKVGETDFTLIDEKEDVAFGRMYSGKGGYRGYSHDGCFDPKNKNYKFWNKNYTTKQMYHATYEGNDFIANNGEFVIPEDFYFMMGDNSYNSRDSRYFGPVPRKNLVGRAAFCWWPLSRRWGFTDKAEPENFDSDGKFTHSDFEQQ